MSFKSDPPYLKITSEGRYNAAVYDIFQGYPEKFSIELTVITRKIEKELQELQELTDLICALSPGNRLSGTFSVWHPVSRCRWKNVH